MGAKVPGRRLMLQPGQTPLDVLEKAGDYCGPVMGFSGPAPAVFFLVPNGNGDKFETLHHVCSPPHRFVEESNGSLSIFESIGCGPSGAYYYHGYLRSGVWEEC